MNHVLRMRAEHHRRLAALLQAAMPDESVAFILCRRIPAHDAVIYLADEVIAVEHHEYARRAHDIASVTPLTMARVAQRARATERVIVMAHLHPMTEHHVGFSMADHAGNRRSFAFFHHRVRQPEHLAVVWNSRMDECAGLVYRSRGDPKALDSAVVVDNGCWQEFVVVPGPLPARFARQAMLLGEAGQRRLSAINAAVIGLGGTGSLASMALVHHGVRRLTLVDDQLLEETNLPRVPASAPTDVRLRSKVEIARDYVLAHAPDAKVEALQQHVEHDDVMAYLIASDVIVICTDNTTSRAYINQLSQQYLIPVLDLGVQFSVNRAGAVVNEIGRINLVRPGTPCLWCSGHISPERLAAESVPPHQRERKESYLRGFDDPQPSMMAFNMEIVGRGIEILIGFITGLFDQPIATYEQRSFLNPKGGSMSRLVTKAYRQGCPICRTTGCGSEVAMTISRRAA